MAPEDGAGTGGRRTGKRNSPQHNAGRPFAPHRPCAGVLEPSARRRVAEKGATADQRPPQQDRDPPRHHARRKGKGRSPARPEPPTVTTRPPELRGSGSPSNPHCGTGFSAGIRFPSPCVDKIGGLHARPTAGVLCLGLIPFTRKATRLARRSPSVTGCRPPSISIVVVIVAVVPVGRRRRLRS